MPTMAASTGSFSVSGVMRALEPCTISTISPWPAPTVSTTTNVRPVFTSRSRWAGSTRSGSTVSSLCPVIEATFCVATTLPVTRARNMMPSLFGKPFGDLGQDLLVGREAEHLPLAEDLFAVDGDVEDAAAALRHRRLHLEAVRLLDRGHQTGGETAVASGRAVLDVNLHLLFLRPLRSPTAALSPAGRRSVLRSSA